MGGNQKQTQSIEGEISLNQPEPPYKALTANEVIEVKKCALIARQCCTSYTKHYLKYTKEETTLKLI
jgi:hypothetical protein